MNCDHTCIDPGIYLKSTVAIDLDDLEEDCLHPPPHTLSNKYVEKLETTITKDGRLFPGVLLYCEGHEKPTLRGISHLIASLFCIFGLMHLFSEANGIITGQIVGLFYASTMIFCYGCSALYHVGRWSLRTEILLQKLDHCGIALLGCGTMLPTAFLLLPAFQGLLLGFLAISTCLWACWNIAHCRPSILRLAMVGLTIVPFLPTLSHLMDPLEYGCTLLVYVFQACGLTIFVLQRPNPWPSIFGYHEIFHLFVLAAGACVYIANWSVIRHTCNMYHPKTVWEDISSLCDTIAQALLFL